MEEVQEKIYIKADRNVEVTCPEVTVGDVIKVECTNQKILAKIQRIQLLKFQESKDKNKDDVVIV